MITADIVAQIPLFARLPVGRQAQIASRAADVRLQPGEWLIQEGEVPAFFALLEGSLDVTKTVAGTEQVINRYVPGDYFGELPLLLGSVAVASLRAREVVRVLRLSPPDFHALIVGSPEISGELLRTMAVRVEHLQQIAVDAPVATVQVIGHRWDLPSLTLRDFLARNHVAFEWVDPEDPVSSSIVALDGFAPADFPLVVLHDGSLLAAPSLRALAERLGLQTAPHEDGYDLAIVGAGPAGLGAAVYGASEGLRTVLIERHAPGGQAGTSSRIENYLGFPAGVSGEELSARAWQQARRFGVEILIAREVTAIAPSATERVVILDGTDRLRCRSLVLTAGVSWRRLGVPELDRLVGRGVYYGAAQTEALGTRGQDVFLIGGGNSAGQAAMFFANYARTVTLLVRRDGLEATMSRYLIDQLQTKSNVAVVPHSEVVGAHGDDHLESIVIQDVRNGRERVQATAALFVFIGADAQTTWLPDAIGRDHNGYVLTGRDVLADPAAAEHWRLGRDPYLLETSVPGIFAAGDVRCGSIKRVASAVGEGCMSIAFVHQYLEAAAPGHDR